VTKYLKRSTYQKEKPMVSDHDYLILLLWVYGAQYLTGRTCGRVPYGKNMFPLTFRKQKEGKGQVPISSSRAQPQ
jgi:hypothetical protein